MDHPRNIDHLCEQLRDADWTRRREAAWALAGGSDARAVPRLIECLQDPAADVRQAAAYALGQLRDPRAIQPLVERLPREVPDVRRDLVAALQPFGEAVADALIQRLQRRDRATAAWALGELRCSEAVVPLLGLLGDRDPLVRQAAAEALGTLGDLLAVGRLLVSLRDREASVRAAAARSLGAIRRLEALPALQDRLRFLGEGDEEVREAIRAAIEAIHSPDRAGIPLPAEPPYAGDELPRPAGPPNPDPTALPRPSGPHRE